MEKHPTNKLSIYLIKEQYSAINIKSMSIKESIFKNHEKLKVEEIGDVGHFYYGESHVNEPSWVKKFFGSSFENNLEGDHLKIFTASSKSFFLVKIDNRLFALTFGYGHMLLKHGIWEDRFGLKVALSVINPDNLRSIDKKNMSIVPKLTKEQMTKDGTLLDFGVDVEQDLIQGITGKTKIDAYGKTVTGKDALSVSVKVDISNIRELLKDCYKRYKDEDYKKQYSWIDNVSEIKNPRTIENMDNKLLENIKNRDFDKTWMAVPEILKWEDVDIFKFKQESFGDDINLPKYLSFLTDEQIEKLSLETIKKHDVNCISAKDGNSIHQWKIYNCLYCEINIKDQVYILSNGKWYEIENNFAKKVSASFESFRKKSTTVTLPDHIQGDHENIYNKKVGKIKGICNMDRKLIYHGGANQKIEFCDLLTKDKKIIHVKHYGASNVLSHLFFQGLVSGQLLLSDEEFREKLNKKLDKPEYVQYKLPNVSERPDASEYEIIFAIISKSKKDLTIPFFSKVNIKNVRERLESYGYEVSLLKIATIEKS